MHAPSPLPAPADEPHVGGEHGAAVDAEEAATDRFRGWRVVRAGLAVQTLQGALMQQAYGSYAVALRGEFGWSSTILSAAYSLNRLESGLLGPVHGWALQRFGVRRVMQFGTVVMAAGLMLFSQINSVGTFFGFYLIAAIGASLSGFLTVVTATVQWFERKRSTALAISQAGFAVGGLSAPLLVWCFDVFGWRATSFATGVVILVTLLPLSMVFGSTPESTGQPVDGLSAAQAAELDSRRGAHRARVSKVHFTAAQAVRTRAFWMISLGHSSALLVVGAVMAHLQLYLTEDHDFSRTGAATVAAILPLVQLVGQFGGGYLGDRISKQVIVVVAMVGHVTGLLLLAFATHNWMIWAFIPLHGLAWGVRGPLMQAMRADYFGSGSFGQIMGISSLIIMIGQIGGPLLAGWLDDTTGSYRIGFAVVAIMASLGMVFFALATPPPPPSLAGPIE
ncbi:MAG: MFS transporter [Acidimicrobiales bacterium]